MRRSGAGCRVWRSAALGLLLAATPTISQEPTSFEIVLDPVGLGLPTRGQWRNGFDLGDLDGDGNVDLVHGPPRAGHGRPTIYLGNGSGDFRLWEEASFPDLAYDYGDVATTDFNGDAAMDLALAVHLGPIIVLRGDRDGGFQTWNPDDHATPAPEDAGDTAFSSRAIEAVDWNLDGLPDLVALSEGPSPGSLGNPRGPRSDAYGLRIYLNPGNQHGRWTPHTPADDSPSTFGDSFAAADLNADGLLDIVTASNVSRNLSIVKFGRPDGSWDPFRVAELADAHYIQAVAVSAEPGPPIVATASTRLSEGTWIASLDLLRWQTAGGFSRRTVAQVATRGGFTALAWGNLNTDTHADLVALDSSGGLWVLTGGPAEGTAALMVGADGQGCGGRHVRLVDLDHDGRDEIVAAFADEMPPSGRDLRNPAASTCISGGSIRAWTARQP